MSHTHFKGKYDMRTACGRTWKQKSSSTETPSDVTCPACKSRIEVASDADAKLGSYEIKDDRVAGSHGDHKVTRTTSEQAIRQMIRLVIEASAKER